MVSYKRCFYAFSIVLILLNGQLVESSQLGELQARKYINHLLDSLFIPNNHPVSYQQNLHNFTQGLTNDLTRRLGSFPHFYSFSKVYSDDVIYQEVINESLALIQQSAHNLTIAAIQQYYYETTGNQKAFVDKVVGLLIKEIRTKLAKTSVLPQGFFTGYFGKALETKVHVLVEKELKKESDRLQKLNARIHCPTCTVKFDAESNKKITLNCNHSICLGCLKNLWNNMGSAIECNQCKAKITISEYVQEAWATPAADYYYDDTTYYYQEPNAAIVAENYYYYQEPTAPVADNTTPINAQDESYYYY